MIAALLAASPAFSISRADLLRGAGAASFMSPLAAHALSSDPADNELVPTQILHPSKLDVNNSPVADYMKFPGMYPTIAGKIANHGPYTSVKDIYKTLSSTEGATAKKYENYFVASKPNPLLDPMRGRDPYRAQYNEMRMVKL